MTWWLRVVLFFFLLRVKWSQETAERVTTITTTMTEWEWKEALKTKRGDWKRRRPKLLLLLLLLLLLRLFLFLERRERGVGGGGRRVCVEPRKCVRRAEREGVREVVRVRARWWLRERLTSMDEEGREREEKVD